MRAFSPHPKYNYLFVFSLFTTNGALARLLLLFSCIVKLNACQFRVDHDTATIFANDDFLVHLDVEMALWRNLVEATAASVALYIDDAKTVTCALADALERGE